MSALIKGFLILLVVLALLLGLAAWKPVVA